MNIGLHNLWTRLARAPFLVLGLACLVAAVWGGLVRLPVNVPLPVEHANWLTFHGPLMVCGFLGTVIGLERAVALPGIWPYAAPLLSAAGGVAVMSGVLGSTPPLLMACASFVFWAVTLRVVRMQVSAFTIVMSLGGLCWIVGNLLWLAGWTFPRLVWWWIAFLVLTIVGERLDLSRFQKPSRWSAPLLNTSLGVFGAGVIATALAPAAGVRVTGLGLLALAGWLVRFDIARRTVRQRDLPRFMAVCLLAGYFWLAVAGVLLVLFAPLESGVRYDAALHAIFLGFVFSMIFGHAPVIFPAVLRLQPAFHPRLYAHVVLLHGALVIRLGADLAASVKARQWGAILNGVALLAFLLNTVSLFIEQALKTKPAPVKSRAGKP